MDILQYLKNGTYPKSANKNDQLTIRRLSTNYIIWGEQFYRKSYDGIHLLCITTKEAQQIIEEVHESSYGLHMNAHILSRKIMRQYFWLGDFELLSEATVVLLNYLLGIGFCLFVVV